MIFTKIKVFTSLHAVFYMTTQPLQGKRQGVNASHSNRNVFKFYSGDTSIAIQAQYIPNTYLTSSFYISSCICWIFHAWTVTLKTMTYSYSQICTQISIEGWFNLCQNMSIFLFYFMRKIDSFIARLST